MIIEKFNELQKQYCNLDDDYKVAFVLKTGWFDGGMLQKETTLYILNKTVNFENIYYMEDDSEYGDPDGGIMAIINESMYYYEPPFDDYEKWYIEVDAKQTEKYRGKQWFEVKKDIYEKKSSYKWFDKSEFFENYDNPYYILNEEKPLVHLFTSALKD